MLETCIVLKVTTHSGLLGQYHFGLYLLVLSKRYLLFQCSALKNVPFQMLLMLPYLLNIFLTFLDYWVPVVVKLVT